MTPVINKTPLEFNERLSKKFNCNIFFKREDKQPVRSFKIRGAYNRISNLNDEQKDNGVVCASAGNHAQGFAFSCNKLNIKGDIFLPTKTPIQKVIFNISGSKFLGISKKFLLGISLTFLRIS